MRPPEPMPWLARVVHAGTAAALATYVFEAPLRYGLALAGMEALLYLRDGVFAAAVVYGLASAAVNRERAALVPAVLVLSVWVTVGLVQLDNAQQVAFGLKLFLPLAAGMAVGPQWLARPRLLARIAALLWLTACVGLAADYLIKLPWAGQSYAVMGQEVQASRVWYSGGVERLSGFSRASFEAAAQVLLLSLTVLCLTPMGVLRRAALWALTGAAVAVTTTKGIIGAFVMCLLAYLFLQYRQLAGLAKGLALTAVLATTLIPFLGLQGLFELHGAWARVVFGSMLDRMLNTWPRALQDYLQHGWMTGGGLGSIGVPQIYYERFHHNPADNVVIYLLSVGGVLGALLWLRFARDMLLLDLVDGRQRLLFLTGLCVGAAGLSLNVIESAWLSFAVGVFLACQAPVLEAPGERLDDLPPNGVTA